MTLHYRTEITDLVGTAAAAIELIADITSGANALDIPAFFLDAVSTGVMTTAEALSGQFLVNARTLAPDILECQVPRGVGGVIAVNIGEIKSYGKLFPFMPYIGDVKNKVFTFQYDALIPEPTSEMCALASLLYTDEPYPIDIMANNGLASAGGLRTRNNWSKTAVDDIAGTALAMAFPDAETITVPGWVEELTAIGIQQNFDAVPTAGEHVMGYIEVGGTHSNLYPMQVPMPSSFPTLGAPVAGTYNCFERILPFHLICPPVDFELNFTTVVDQITTGAISPVVTMYGRGKLPGR